MDNVMIPDPVMPSLEGVPSLRWGVIGPGKIANIFVDAVQRHTGQRIVAVASTQYERAVEFADRFHINDAYGHYADLLSSSDVDVVYIANRQEGHFESTLDAIAAGKHVLVEKPIAMFPSDVRAIADAAAHAGVLVMEALWSSYLPQAYVIRQLVSEGILGQIRWIQADLGQDLRGRSHRLFEPNGGGAALDMGIYPVAFAGQFFPQGPLRVSATGSLTHGHLDAESAIRMEFPSGAVGIAGSSMVSFTAGDAWVDGESLSLGLRRPFFVPTTLSLYRREFGARPIANWKDSSEIQGHEGLCYQAAVLAEYVGRGVLDSEIRPLSHSLRDIDIIAQARHAIGAIYPNET